MIATRRQRYRQLVGYACAFLCAAIAALALWAIDAAAAPCVTCRPQAVIVQKPIAAAKVYYPQQYYAVGQSLQQQARDTHGFRNSAEWSEFLQLRGYKLGVEQMLQAQAAQAQSGNVAAPQSQMPPENVRPEGPQLPPPVATLPPGAPAQPPAPPVERKYPALFEHCAKCHGGDDPKGAIWLDGSVDLNGPDAAETRDAIVRVLWLGHMPPDNPASDEVVGQILSELYRE